MRIIIDIESGIPIYEQIESEIRGQILAGKLEEDEALPSIRTLARELKVGIITAKRAYDDLCAEGFCYSVQGKGIFVSKSNKVAARNYVDNELRARIRSVVEYAKKNSVDGDRLLGLVKEITGE